MTEVDMVVTVGTPLTTPVAATVATVIVALLHAPPATVLLSEVVAPEHTVGVPLMVDGGVLTVTFMVLRQPVVVIW